MSIVSFRLCASLLLLLAVVFSSSNRGAFGSTCDSPCTPNECLSAPCADVNPYLCLVGPNINGCSPTPWPSAACASCCDYTACYLPCSTDCSAEQCSSSSCTTSNPDLCTGGNAAGQCGAPDQWSVAAGCTSCCNASNCDSTPAPTASTPQPPASTAAPTLPPTTATPTPIPTASPPTPAPTPVPSPTSPATPLPTPSPSPPAPTSTPAPVPPTTAAPPGTCGPCSASWCSRNNCNTKAPYVCMAGPAKGGCGVQPWQIKPSICSECCSILNCFSGCETCDLAVCTAKPCPVTDPYVCTGGPSKGGCSAHPWEDPVQCTSCCALLNCSTPVPTPAPSTGPPTPSPPATPTPPTTFPPPLTPEPGWTNNLTPFPPATSIPAVPQRTAIPSSAYCPPCSGSICTNASTECNIDYPFFCTDGVTGCQNYPWTSSQGCNTCCNLQPCLVMPTPYPPTPWAHVPFPQNCNLSTNGSIFGAPNPAATEFGAIDVSTKGCRAKVSEACCGETPRFNWILATCSEDPAHRVSMACNHTFGNTSKMELYYIHAYQWNTSGQVWVLDPNSSVSGDTLGGIINWSETNMKVGQGIINGAVQDWDAKYAPTTNNSGTNGLGPPGLMFVMSAKQFTWSSLYLLNQLTLNLGPDSDSNCWGSSAGELDFLEPPFWAGVELPGDYLFTTVTANAGRCFPVQKSVAKRFSKECNDPNCCEMCSCPEGLACFGNPAHAGYHAMSCIDVRAPPPGGDTVVFTVDGSNASCGQHYGSIAGGANSSAFFAHDNALEDQAAIFVTIVDGDGVTVFRWPAATSESAGKIWPGIGKYSANETLQRNANRPIPIGPPCRNWLEPCGIYESSCDDECVILSASGTFGTGQAAGEYAAESAREDLNWWNLFESTKQTPDVTSRQLPIFTNVPLHPVPLPFYCNKPCPAEVCKTTGCGMSNQFECINGSATGGCSKEYYTWPTSPFCSACCDVKSCIVPCEATCSTKACDDQECGAKSPEYCMEGTAHGGCSNSTTTWSGCSACCDTRSCPHR